MSLLTIKGFINVAIGLATIVFFFLAIMAKTAASRDYWLGVAIVSAIVYVGFAVAMLLTNGDN